MRADREEPPAPRPGRLIAPSRSDFWWISALVLAVVALATLAVARRDTPSAPDPASAVEEQAADVGEEPPEPPERTGATRPTAGDASDLDADLVAGEAADGDEAVGATTTSTVAVTASTTVSAAPDGSPSTAAAVPAPPATTTPATTTVPVVTVPPPDACETQTQDDSTRGVEVKYVDPDDFASSFRFYGADQQLLYETTDLDDNPTNRVRRDGYHEREWDVASNRSGYEPVDVHHVSAVEPEGESVLIRCARTVVTDGG